ncbi:MAG: TM2 domain-containing protein [Bacteroidia bacterium]
MTTTIFTFGFCMWGFLSPVEEKLSQPVLFSAGEALVTSVAHTPPIAKKQTFFQKVKRGVQKFLLRILPQGGKSWGVALLMAIFLGSLGLHRLYLGHTATGIVMLVLWIVALIFWFTIILAILSVLIWLALFIWSLVDTVLIATRTLGPVQGSYID